MTRNFRTIDMFKTSFCGTLKYMWHLSFYMGISFLHPDSCQFAFTAHTHTMETHSMEKVPSMENFSINQTE